MTLASPASWPALKVVARMVRIGRYGLTSELLREGVRLVQDREAKLAAVARGVADAEAGRVKPAGDVFDRLEARYRAMVKEKGE